MECDYTTQKNYDGQTTYINYVTPRRNLCSVVKDINVALDFQDRYKVSNTERSLYSTNTEEQVNQQFLKKALESSTKKSQKKSPPKKFKKINLDEIDLSDPKYQLKYKQQLTENMNNRRSRNGDINGYLQHTINKRMGIKTRSVSKLNLEVKTAVKKVIDNKHLNRPNSTANLSTAFKTSLNSKLDKVYHTDTLITSNTKLYLNGLTPHTYNMESQEYKSLDNTQSDFKSHVKKIYFTDPEYFKNKESSNEFSYDTSENVFIKHYLADTRSTLNTRSTNRNHTNNHKRSNSGLIATLTSNMDQMLDQVEANNEQFTDYTLQYEKSNVANVYKKLNEEWTMRYKFIKPNERVHHQLSCEQYHNIRKEIDHTLCRTKQVIKKLYTHPSMNKDSGEVD